MKIKSVKKPRYTKTVTRSAVWNIAVMLLLYFLFNIFTIIILDYQLELQLDDQIEHEIEHLLNTFYLVNDSLVVTNPAELRESDLIGLTDSPFFLQVYTHDGRILLRSENLNFYESIPVEYLEFGSGHFVVKNITLKKEDIRTGYHAIHDQNGNNRGFIQLSTPKKTGTLISQNIIYFNLLSFPFVVVVIIVISFILAKKNFAPINKIIDLANRISTSNLSERLQYDADSGDELGRLRDTLNDLFERLEFQVKNISDFTDNASHQLRSPLTVLNTELELLLRQQKAKKGKETLQILHEQVARMIHIVNTLLILAKSCNDYPDNRTVFNVSKLVKKELKDQFSNNHIIYDIEDGIFLRGNSDYFALVIENLMNNAIKYSPPESRITLRIRHKNSHVKLSVEDLGPGIPEEEKPKIFERFYRGQNGESKDIPGYGLGLSLVHFIIQSMNGEIFVQDNNPHGTIFTIKLPAVPVR